jgi:hypothetical protein
MPTPQKSNRKQKVRELYLNGFSEFMGYERDGYDTENEPCDSSYIERDDRNTSFDTAIFMQKDSNHLYCCCVFFGIAALSTIVTCIILLKHV